MKNDKLLSGAIGAGGAGMVEVVEALPNHGELELGKLILQIIISICTIIAMFRKKKNLE